MLLSEAMPEALTVEASTGANLSSSELIQMVVKVNRDCLSLVDIVVGATRSSYDPLILLGS